MRKRPGIDNRKPVEGNGLDVAARTYGLIRNALQIHGGDHCVVTVRRQTAAARPRVPDLGRTAAIRNSHNSRLDAGYAFI